VSFSFLLFMGGKVGKAGKKTTKGSGSLLRDDALNTYRVRSSTRWQIGEFSRAIRRSFESSAF
jgi:hypothetical protein